MNTVSNHLRSALSAAVLYSASVAVNALPVLQLDIIGGSYDAGSETIISTSNQFTLVAYGLASGHNSIPLNDYYYLSIALVPTTGPASPASGIGSFVVDGVSYNGVDGTYGLSDMVFGNPPLETTVAQQGYDPGDLAPHGIYDTFFKELRFQFNAGQRATAVNSQDTPGTTPVNNANGGLYYQLINFDLTGLDPGYNLHFDLYSESFISLCVKSVKCIAGDTDVDKFAPFSHDAESRRIIPPPPIDTSVPEPASVLLLGLGLAGLGSVRRRRC